MLADEDAEVPDLGRLTRTTAMCWAAAEGDVALMQRLHTLGIDVNAGDYDKRTPLHIAASDNQLRAVAFLLQSGAAPDALDRWGRSPRDCARDAGHAAVLALLNGSSSTTSPTPSNSRPDTLAIETGGDRSLARSASSVDVDAFFGAIEAGNTERVKRAWLDGLALDTTDARGRSSLHVAVAHRRVGMIELLLSADVDTAALDDRGRTPLSLAVEKQFFAIAEMLRAHQKLKLAIHAGADGEDQQLVAQAFRATKRGNLAELRRLVPARVHPDVQDYDLRTLLHIASAEGHVEVVRFLVDCGANVNLLDRWGTSALTEAIDFAHNKVARLLLASHANESGNRATIAVDQIDTITLNAALEFTLRVVTRKRWFMGQVYCPMTEESGSCVLVAHGVWHRNDSLLRQRSALGGQDGDVVMASPPASPTARSAALRADPIQMFRKVGSLMTIDPGQGHTGTVFSSQHPEWLNLSAAVQSHFFLLPLARRAGIQTVVSVPMIYKMSTIAVLSWYSDEVVAEEPLELQRIQRLLRSVMILSTLRVEVLAAVATEGGEGMHLPRFQYCQSLDTALTANGELIDPSVGSEDVAVGDLIPLALEWGLFDMVDRLATSMSSEDHAAVISLLRSIVALLCNGFFRDASREDGSPRGLSQHRQTPEKVIAACNGAIRTKRELLVHLRYYLQFLYSVSPTEGTIFMDANALVPQVNRYIDSEGAGTAHASSRRSSSNDPLQQQQGPGSSHVPPPAATAAESEPEPVREPAAPVVECVLCKYKVPGHIHPGKLAVKTEPPKPTVASPPPAPTQLSSGDGYFGVPGNPKSPVYREIATLADKFAAQYDAFSRRADLNTRHWDGNRLGALTSSDLYDAIGAAHEAPSSGRSSSQSASANARKRLLEVMNDVLQDASCVISYDQLMAIHRCLIPEASGQAGVIRSSAAVGYASPRIYRVFLPAGEIDEALRNLVAMLNDAARWTQRPLLCAYYAFAVLVFFIHPFHDGNGRCGRLLGNLLAKKHGYPSLLRAADKTIQVGEFLQKAVVTMEAIQNTRRQTRQSRLLSARKENTSMWF